MRIGLIACCLAFLLIGFFEGLLDMTNIMDGSGLGLLPGHTPIWIVMFFAAPPVIWCIRSLWASGGPARSFIAIPIAVVACLVFFGLGLDRSLFVLSWNHRCAHGESRLLCGSPHRP